jgi:5'-nucleotidase (lipoprotein e(P4) family)
MKQKIYSFILISSLLVSCSSSKKAGVSDKTSDDKLVMAVAWFQHSSEMAALYYQGFNIARERLDEAVALNKANKSLAVVVDIDETMLDNSPFETILMNDTEFAKSWKDWTTKAIAKPLPGALEFANYAKSKNVDVFYITNRDDTERESTLSNLQKVGFPFSVDDHLLTKSDLSAATGNTSSKAGRRAKVAEKHEIILFIGDNLNDFSEIFEDRKTNGGKVAVDRNRDDFGRKFIVLPNPMYGAWEKPLYDYKEGLSEKEKTQLLKSKLKVE